MKEKPGRGNIWFDSATQKSSVPTDIEARHDAFVYNNFYDIRREKFYIQTLIRIPLDASNKEKLIIILERP